MRETAAGFVSIGTPCFALLSGQKLPHAVSSGEIFTMVGLTTVWCITKVDPRLHE